VCTISVSTLVRISLCEDGVGRNDRDARDFERTQRVATDRDAFALWPQNLARACSHCINVSIVNNNSS
jgi:hypothetical protein